jgi:Mn2+/Fe2+ NRAMP family transporter
LVAQGFGWNWEPRDNAGFAAVYTLAILVSAIPIACGLDPLKLTVFSMALTAASLPLTVVPFLFLMNDERYVKEHRNGTIANAAVLFVIALGFVLAIVTIPLEILGG